MISNMTAAATAIPISQLVDFGFTVIAGADALEVLDGNEEALMTVAVCGEVELIMRLVLNSELALVTVELIVNVEEELVELVFAGDDFFAVEIALGIEVDVVATANVDFTFTEVVDVTVEVAIDFVDFTAAEVVVDNGDIVEDGVCGVVIEVVNNDSVCVVKEVVDKDDFL